MKEDNVLIAFITRKEQADIELSIKLQKDGVIMTLRGLFKRSQQQKINDLIAREVFEFVQYNLIKHLDIRIFNSRLINKAKEKATNTLFNKSRLVIQTYNNKGK
jgi:recombinational DNA repair protein (RecF pathway)